MEKVFYVPANKTRLSYRKCFGRLKLTLNVKDYRVKLVLDYGFSRNQTLNSFYCYS